MAPSLTWLLAGVLSTELLVWQVPSSRACDPREQNTRTVFCDLASEVTVCHFTSYLLHESALSSVRGDYSGMIGGQPTKEQFLVCQTFFFFLKILCFVSYTMRPKHSVILCGRVEVGNMYCHVRGPEDKGQARCSYSLYHIEPNMNTFKTL